MFRISRCGIMPKLWKLMQEFLKRGHLNAVALLDFASKNWVAEFIARWRHFLYKFVIRTFSRCI